MSNKQISKKELIATLLLPIRQYQKQYNVSIDEEGNVEELAEWQEEEKEDQFQPPPVKDNDFLRLAQEVSKLLGYYEDKGGELGDSIELEI